MEFARYEWDDHSPELSNQRIPYGNTVRSEQRQYYNLEENNSMENPFPRIRPRESTSNETVDLTNDSDDDVIYICPTKKQKINHKDPPIVIQEDNCTEITEEVNEKRPTKTIKHPSKALLDRASLANKEKIFVIQQKPHEKSKLEREFVILGESGNVYTVKICSRPSCTCPEYTNGKSKTHCKHVLFVLMKVFQLNTQEPTLFQTSLLNSELKKLFSNYEVTAGLMASSAVTEKYLEFTSAERCKKLRKEVAQKPVEGDCPICFEKMNQKDDVVYCKYSCGNNVHTSCFNKWQLAKTEAMANGSHIDQMKCIYCRKRWDTDQAKSVHVKDGYLNLGEFQHRRIDNSLFWSMHDLVRFHRFAQDNAGLSRLFNSLHSLRNPNGLPDESSDDEDYSSDD